MAAELESARDALSTERIGDPGESGGEGEEPIGVVGDEEDVAELESEVCHLKCHEFLFPLAVVDVFGQIFVG